MPPLNVMASNTNTGSPESYLRSRESRASAAVMSQAPSGRVPGIFPSSEHLLALQASSAFQSMDRPANQLNHQLLADLNKRGAEEDLQGRAPKKQRGEPNCGEGNGAYPGHTVGGQASANLNDPYQMLSLLSGGRNIDDQQNSGSNLMLHSEALRRAGLSAQYMQQEQAARNSALLASLTRPQGNPLMQANPSNGMGWSTSFNDRLQDAARTQQLAQLSSLPNASDFLSSAALRSSNSMGVMPSIGTNPYLFSGAHNNGHTGSAPQGEQLQEILRRLSAASHQRAGPHQDHGMGSASQPIPAQSEHSTTSSAQALPRLPPCDEGLVPPYSQRPKHPLGIDEDHNWLSEFHCFVRSELVEVFRASREDCKARNNSIAYHQVGIRCRFCAHISPTARAGRSSAFPSSLRQLYQSFTMMLRDHFGKCDMMPLRIRKEFLALKDKPSQGATDSKRFWIYSGMKVGMADSANGIAVTENTIATWAKVPPFGTSPDQQWADDSMRSVPLVTPEDRSLVPEFLFVLLSNVQLVRLTEAERIGNRRSLQAGLPGFGCRYCCEHRRLGLCRVFPARRRTLPGKITDLHDHIRRCTVCPTEVKEHIEHLHKQMQREGAADQEEEKEFFDRIWARLGHGNKGSDSADRSHAQIAVRPLPGNT
jgi:hypothetical protein